MQYIIVINIKNKKLFIPCLILSVRNLLNKTKLKELKIRQNR